MGYGLGSRLFHWLTVLLLLVMIPSGIVMVQQIPRALQDGLFVLHKGLGSLFLVLILLRLAWRAGHPPPPCLPPSRPGSAGPPPGSMPASISCSSSSRSAAMSG